MLTGQHSNYHWLTIADIYIGQLFELCPEVWKGRSVAITSSDSGEPRWVEELPGWKLRGSIGYGPDLHSLSGLGYQSDGPDTAGFDEWYLFESPIPTDLGEVIRNENPFEEQFQPRPGRVLPFVNWHFAPDAVDKNMEDLEKMFWNQMEWISPESYISDGSNCLSFVTRNDSLFRLVLGRIDNAN